MVKKLFPNILLVVSELKTIFKDSSLYLNRARIFLKKTPPPKKNKTTKSPKTKPQLFLSLSFRGSEKTELLQ